MERICLIVDNPDRDLDGLVLLAATLARRGADVFLVPMYNQRLEVAGLRPDFVLMNYARAANRPLMRAYSRQGVAVGVLDTEGGLWESDEMFVHSVDREAVTNYVDLYCLWGQRQRRAFLALTGYPPDKFVVTGNPRYDFYAEPWVRTIPEARASTRQAQILLISNFCLAYPKYARGSLAEIENMVDAGFERSMLEERLKADRQARQELIAVAEKLSSEFPNVDWVLRPHPFEDESEYLSRFSRSLNVFVRGDLTVAPWIRGSKLVIHANSSVAIDSYMLGTSQVCIDWIDNPILREWANLVTWKVSKKAMSFDSLRQIVSNTVGGSDAPAPVVSDDPAAGREIDDWFHPSDGQAAVRVTNAILRLLSERKKVRKPKAVALAVASASLPQAMRRCVELVGGIVLGTRKFGFIRSAARSIIVNRKPALNRYALKDLDIGRVEAKLSELRDLVQGSLPLHVATGRRGSGDMLERRLTQNSVRVFTNECRSRRASG